MTPTLAPIPMPRLSDSMEEGTVLRWLKAPGDRVSRGDELVEIETDKATIVYESEVDGVLGELVVAEGASAPLGAPIAHVLLEGTDGANGAAPAAPADPEPAAAAAGHPVAPRPEERKHAGGAPASPVARRLARELGVPLETVKGSGPNGRILRDDVLAAAQAAQSEAAPAAAHVPPATAPAADAEPAAVAVGGTRHPLTATQRTIARRMVASRTEIPEFTLTAEIDMTAAQALRADLAAAAPETRVSVNDLVVRAAALALRDHPGLNASWDGDAIVRHARINVGVAVAAEEALLVPVVEDADRRSLAEIAAATRAAGERARARTSTPDELEGATFTVSNLGMLGVLSFTAVIDAPRVAILAVGAVTRVPRFADDGTVVSRDVMHVTLSCDHRAVYGVDGAHYLGRLRELLEHPLCLLL